MARFKFYNVLVSPVILMIAVLLAACSSAPKRPAEIRLQRISAETQLELANQQAERGNFEGALAFLAFARQFAVSSDDPRLRVRTGLSQGNIFFSQGRREEAAAEWARALAEASATGDAELEASARIYSARGRLLSAIAEGSGTQAAAEVKSEVSRDIARIKKDQLSIALGWTVVGLADKESRSFTDAEAALKKALNIHVKGNYLEQAAYDWYVIASIRSVAGNYSTAAAALGEAIALDRRAENSWGLAMDWRALAEVYRKGGNSAQAEAAAVRSAEILDALGQTAQGTADPAE